MRVVWGVFEASADSLLTCMYFPFTGFRSTSESPAGCRRLLRPTRFLIRKTSASFVLIRGEPYVLA